MRGGRAITSRDGPLFRFDAGWLYLVSGCALIAATVLIPATRDLREAQWHRDRALAVEQWRSKRLENYSAYLDALDRGDESLALSLAQTQLNLAPEGKQALVDVSQDWPGDASVFDALEPEFAPAIRPQEASTLLGRLATGERSRLWLLALGGMLLLVGLMPAESERVEA